MVGLGRRCIARAFPALAAAALTAGCGLATPTPPTATPNTDSAAAPPVTATCGAGSLVVALDDVSLAPAPPVLDAATVPSLQPVSHYYHLGTRDALIDTVALPGDDAFNAEVGRVVTDTLATYFAVAAEQVPGPDDAGERLTQPTEHLTGGWSLTAASGTVVGVSLSFARTAAGVEPAEFATEVVYTDASAAAAWSGANLLTDQGRAVAQGCIHRILSAHGLLSLAGQSGDNSEVYFDAQGAVYVMPPVGQLPVGESADAAQAVRFEARAASTLLDEAGTRVRAAIETSLPFAAPGTAASAGADQPAIDPVPPPPGGQASQAVDCTQVPCVALTFDDGPSPQTPGLLAILAQYGVKATFFMLGSNIAKHPDIAASVAAGGHEIGNHSWSHANLTTLDDAQVFAELASTSQVAQATFGRALWELRPPYGSYDDRIKAAAGGPLILWSVDPEDWKYRDTATVTANVLGAVQPGSIVLIHDLYATSVAAVPAIIEQLQARGFHFVTVSEMFAPQVMQAGQTYSHGPTSAIAPAPPPAPEP